MSHINPLDVLENFKLLEKQELQDCLSLKNAALTLKGQMVTRKNSGNTREQDWEDAGPVQRKLQTSNLYTASVGVREGAGVRTLHFRQVSPPG